ncbi:MAG: T9SS type A sorting domain-containing protein [Bacteroidia bacterium]|nr:T9SS type A sorting domain-containing protein [Bacteroidia bacterium]
MYPNPNDGNFYFNYSLPENEKCRFAVFDQIGKKVYSIDIKSGRNTVIINSNDFSNGVYYYQVTAGNRLVKTERLVITK